MSTRLLLIEDEPLLCDLFAEYVELMPDIDFLGDARDGAEAIEKCRALKPDLAIVDIRMPGNASGLSVLAVLRAELPETKVIIFTGTVDERSLREALAHGADAYIEKGYGLAELRKGIEAVLGGQRYYSRGIARLVKSLEPARV